MPKKRNHGDGGLYYVKSQNLWRGVVDVGFWPDGRRRQKSVSSRSQREARAKLERLKAEISEYGAPLDKTTTVAGWAEHWLDTVCRPHMKPRPFAAYQSLVRVWIVPAVGRKRITQMKPSDLRAVTASVTAAGRSSSTALRVHNVMSAMLESARLDGLVGRNIARDVIPPKAAQSNRESLSTEAALAVLRTAAQHPDGTRWWVALLAGVRQGERNGALLNAIDFDAHTFTVEWSLTEARFRHGCDGACGKTRGGSCPSRQYILADGLDHVPLAGRLILVRPKSGKARTFSLIPPLEEALKRYITASAKTPNPHGLLWRNADGSPITSAQDQAAWRALLLEAGVITEEQAKEPKDRAPGTLDTPTTHWARHTTATVLMELGVDAKIIGEIVGHGSIPVTRRYQHVTSSAAQAALEAIGDHFAGALG